MTSSKDFLLSINIPQDIIEEFDLFANIADLEELRKSDLQDIAGDDIGATIFKELRLRKTEQPIFFEKPKPKYSKSAPQSPTLGKPETSAIFSNEYTSVLPEAPKLEKSMTVPSPPKTIPVLKNSITWKSPYESTLPDAPPKDYTLKSAKSGKEIRIKILCRWGYVPCETEKLTVTISAESSIKTLKNRVVEDIKIRKIIEVDHRLKSTNFIMTEPNMNKEIPLDKLINDSILCKKNEVWLTEKPLGVKNIKQKKEMEAKQ